MTQPLARAAHARRPLVSYRQLAVWQRAMALAIACHRLADRLPPVQRFGLGSQIRRAAGSIPANIAEGCGRLHRAEYVHHLAIARGSLKELETHLIIAHRLGHITRTEAAELERACTLIGRMLSRLIVSLYTPSSPRHPPDTPTPRHPDTPTPRHPDTPTP